jgi:nucleotide-binding universal stress UspA family protein
MFASILLPVDLGDSSSWERALPIAAALARSFSAQLHLITVLPEFGMPIVGSYFPDDFEARTFEVAKQALATFVAEHVAADLKAETHIGHGTIYSEIIKAADRLGCDLIVMASHRPEMRDYLLGPNAARVARHSARSVLIVRP